MAGGGEGVAGEGGRGWGHGWGREKVFHNKVIL